MFKPHIFAHEPLTVGFIVCEVDMVFKRVVLFLP